jgi:hypothetical protein
LVHPIDEGDITINRRITHFGYWMVFHLFLVLASNPLLADTKFGMTPFPYDFTEEAVRNTAEIIARDADMFAIHLDECVPWGSLFSGKGLPSEQRKKWADLKSQIPAGHAVYVGLAPLKEDRETLALACNDDMPAAMRGAGFDSTAVKKAYLNYVREAVTTFNPQFLNIGIEVEGIAARRAHEWPAFERLFEHVKESIQRDNPNIKIGVSLTLHALLVPRIANTVKPLVEKSDYLGLSVYPYASSFGEAHGYPPLGEGVDRWRNQLTWVRSYTSKPIAIAETGFTTKDINLAQYGLKMSGNVDDQAAYVHDLIRLSKYDDYLFVVWFLPVDYERLYTKMPKTPGVEINLLWRNIGLYDSDLSPKKALKEWRAFRNLSAADIAEVDQWQTKALADPPKPKTSMPKGVKLGFSSKGDLLTCAPGTSVNFAEGVGPDSALSGMRWKFTYQGDWQWCLKDLKGVDLSATKGIYMWVRSDRAGTLFVNLDTSDGEGYFSTAQVGTGWSMINIPYSELIPDPDKKKDGKFRGRDVTQLLIADAGAGAGATGVRNVWFSELYFTY